MPEPSCDGQEGVESDFQGFLKGYLDGITDQWLLVAPRSNPAMLEMFRDRDRRPLRKMVPWAGEFAGKYLTSAVQILRLTQDEGLRRHLVGFVQQLISLQSSDGYLGPWPKEFRLTNKAPNSKPEGEGTWDTWGHYHIMLGLLMWHQDTGSEDARKAAESIADLMCEKYLGDRNPRLVDTGSTEMNLAIVHSLALLHRHTGHPRYLDMALQIVNEFEATNAEGKPMAGDYVRTALAGKEFFQTPKPRWESLHSVMGLVELYYATGNEDLKTAFEHIWKSISLLDRHSNGGFSSDERAQGNPYHQGAIETCCTISWIALTVEMLRLSCDPRVADELELSTLNSVVGMHSHTGRWVTYNTPMDGVRQASAHTIVFQAREGSPELNCCSVNGPRGFGLISDWALMGDRDGLILNWYGPCSMKVPTGDGETLELEQQTDYPCDGRIKLTVSSSTDVDTDLRLRIPRWSRETSIESNGHIATPEPGTYHSLGKHWEGRRTVGIDLDMHHHYWVGDKECAGKVSIYRGPLLLAYDRRFNEIDPDDIPTLDARGLMGKRIAWDGEIPPLLLMEFEAIDGHKLRLCDFGSAGEGGSPYMSWLRIINADKEADYWSAS